MNKSQTLRRIVTDQSVMAGKPLIMGTRLTAEHILGLLAQGVTHEEIMGEYPGVTEEDIRACLYFAAKMLEDTGFMPSFKQAG